jgi:hypothetical protein
MFFFTPPTIAVMQTGHPIAAGMQSMKLPTTIANFQRIDFRAERERDGRGDHDESYNGFATRSEVQVGPSLRTTQGEGCT